MDVASDGIQTLGRPVKVTLVEITREVTEADLAGLGTDRGVKPPAIKRIAEVHHLIARLVAEGEAGYAISAATGYSQSRISILKADPAFQELVARYQTDVDGVRSEHYFDTFGKTVALRNLVLDQMIDNVIDGGLGHRDLKEYGEFAMDRTGFGPQSKSTNLNVNMEIAEKLSARRLKAAEFTEAVPAAKAAKGIRSVVTGTETATITQLEGRRPSTGSNDDQLEAVQLLPPSIREGG